MALKIVRTEIVLLTETHEGNCRSTFNYELTQITDGLTRVDNAAIAFAVYDADTGEQLRKVALKPGSPEFQRVVNLELAPDSPEQVVA